MFCILCFVNTRLNDFIRFYTMLWKVRKTVVYSTITTDPPIVCACVGSVGYCSFCGTV